MKGGSWWGGREKGTEERKGRRRVEYKGGKDRGGRREGQRGGGKIRGNE